MILSPTHLFLELFLSFAHPGYFGMCVDNGRNTIIVDVGYATAHTFHTDDAFILSFVGQHWPRNHIPDGIDAGVKIKEGAYFLTINS